MATILDGKIIRDRLALEMAGQIAQLKTKPTLVIFQVGEMEDSNAYIRQKKLFAEKIGAVVVHKQYPESASHSDILAEIKKINANAAIHGIIVQLPLPPHLDRDTLIEAIDPKKDVDGMTSVNLKKLWENNPAGFVPATSRGILTLLDAYKIPVAEKRVVVVGRSTFVGKPTALAFLNRDATVTVAHNRSKNLSEITRQADILVVAIGDPEFITALHVKKGAVVVDVGINVSLDAGRKKFDEEISLSDQGAMLQKSPTRKLVGDVDFASVEPRVSAISPVPGGVGPMTVLSLFQNLLESM